jgi:hypothetical protein
MNHSYDYYVTEGKKLLHAVETHQVLIAHYALQVCELIHGGKQGRSKYTLKDYACDIGMHHKTLNEWTHVYRNVIQKLNIELSEVTSEDWRIASRVSNIVRSEKRALQEQMGLKRKKGRGWDIKVQVPTERIRDLFTMNRNGRSPEQDFCNWLDTVIHIKNKLRRADLTSISEASLRSMKMNLEEASSEITNHLIGNRGVSMTNQGVTI